MTKKQFSESFLSKARSKIISILGSGSGSNERPYLKNHNESNIPGFFIIGDLAGAVVIKHAMEQGFKVIEHISSLLKKSDKQDPKLLDVLVIGGGAAGLNAALQASESGMQYLLLEKEVIANTIENFPEGKWVYAEPDKQPPKGKLWLDGSTKEDLIKRWHQIITENELKLHTNEPVIGCKKINGIFHVSTPKSTYLAKYVVLASGQRGNPKKLEVSGEDQEHVYHRLYSPRKYHNENILVVGGGNSAVEAAIILSQSNNVTLSYRGTDFSRVFNDNKRKLQDSIQTNKLKTVLSSSITEFKKNQATLEIQKNNSIEKQQLPFDHAFVLIGSDVPRDFLKSLGLKMENDWEGNLLRSIGLTVLGFFGAWLFGVKQGGDFSLPVDLSFIPTWTAVSIWLISLTLLTRYGLKGDRFCWLGISFFVWYSIYGVKVGKGEELWPYTNWGYEFLSFFDRPWAFWYTVLFTTLMTIFGLQALKRWGIDHKDNYQIWRYICLLSFQWSFFFLIPEFLFQTAVNHQWIGERLASDPTFAEQAWRSYGIIYAWPLFFYTFFYDPHQVWVVWGVFLTFIIIPIFVLFQGKRYCSWICGCGGLAETLGDRWRHLAPKGKNSVWWEWMNLAVLIFATLVTILVLIKDTYGLFSQGADIGIQIYRIYADVWLVGILPVTLYPFLGGKIWCRYWCPLAKLMELQAQLFSKLKWARFKIIANEKCIGCDECSRNCQVGIDVMNFALKQEVLDNKNSSCIACGICVTTCPMDVLSFDKLVQIDQPPLSPTQSLSQKSF